MVDTVSPVSPVLRCYLHLRWHYCYLMKRLPCTNLNGFHLVNQTGWEQLHQRGFSCIVKTQECLEEKIDNEMDFFFSFAFKESVLVSLPSCCNKSNNKNFNNNKDWRGNFYSHQPAPLVAKAQVGEPVLKPARRPGNPHAAHFLKDQPTPF